MRADPVKACPEASTDGDVRCAPPPPQVVEARRLVEGWLSTSFIGRGDAIEDLIVRIARLLAVRDQHLPGRMPRMGGRLVRVLAALRATGAGEG